MHHMYPVSKGDQLCPLGFHPQVRWPTRCKRCFRDYKEHGSKRGDDVAASSPSLSDPFGALDKNSGRSWTSTSNLSTTSGPAGNGNHSSSSADPPRTMPKRPSSWTSTPDLDESSESNRPDVVVNVPLPRRRHTSVLDISQVEESITIRRPPLPPMSKEAPEDLVIMRSDSLAERARKMQLKKQSSVERETSREKSVPRTVEKEKSPAPDPQDKLFNSRDLIMFQQMKDEQAKKKRMLAAQASAPENGIKSNGTKSNETVQDQLERLRRELAETKTRAERAEREKSDILLRRLASMDTSTNRTAAAEALKLQQKVNELSQHLEDVTSQKKCLVMRVKDLEHSHSNRIKDNELSKKLKAAEQLCEDLMDENKEVKKELQSLESEIDEMHDNFREEQANEYTTVKKDLETTVKNCRILSFKFKKSERRIEQLELEKQLLASQVNSELANKVKQLEEEVRLANETSKQLKTQVETTKGIGKVKAPSLGTIGKSTSADGKYSRASLTRGGSQEDPVQLMRDLQDSMEREADIREQLKFAEEEAENLRKKSSRVEDENESLMMQLKKMASRSRSRKLSPTPPHRGGLAVPVDKDEGISDEEDPAELRVLLELNEQESTQLRRKVEELERYNDANRKQITDLQEKLKSAQSTPLAKGKLPTFMSKTLAGERETEKKLKDFERDIAELKKQIQEKDRSIDQLQRTINKNQDSLPTANSSSLNVDLQKKLKTFEQESAVLRTKVQSLEIENDKVTTENKKLAMAAARITRKDSLTNSADNQKSIELTKVKEELTKYEEQCKRLEEKLTLVLETAGDKLPPRTPKRCSDSNTKFQLQKMIGELEMEILEQRAIIVRTGANTLQKLESEHKQTLLELTNLKEKLDVVQADLKTQKALNESTTSQLATSTDLKKKLKAITDQCDAYSANIKTLESQATKQEIAVKQAEASKTDLLNQLKLEKSKAQQLDKELQSEKNMRLNVESKMADGKIEIATNTKLFEKTKENLENEIKTLKARNAGDAAPTKKVQELRKQLEDLLLEQEREKKRFSDLNGKYEQLEEEHILVKAQLITDKENLQTSLNASRNMMNDREAELRNLKKEKIDLSRKLTEAMSKVKDTDGQSLRITTLQYEKNRIKMTLDERDQQISQLRDENDMNKDVCSQMKREIDELKRKLSDFERVNKAQNSMSDHSSGLEQELRKLKHKLEASEVACKSEVAATRLRYEHQINNLHTEMTSLQKQSEKFKRDRETFKQLLEGAQKSITDLKNSNSGRASRASMNSGDEADKSKIATLVKQVDYLEDELCEAKLEVSKIKTELVSERSMSEIKISEMTSRLNEYEEDRLINSGRTKIAGMKTKLELAWQKEREDQQRILQETSTLARDLRQTLFEVERERDKERLETRRKVDLLKKSNEEELDEGRKKVSELQCDLLELRDVHAKLRTSNEKLRRERERYEREKESVLRKRMDHEGERRVAQLLQTVDELVRIAPELISGARAPQTANHNQSPHLQVTDKPRHKSRSPSPSNGSVQLTSTLTRLAEASEDVRKFQRVCEEERDRDRNRRSGMRRAASTENETPEMSRHSRVSRSSPNNGSLYRKSLSLDQSMQQADQAIWKQDDGSMSSMQSIDSEFGGLGRDSSMDSRLSGGSTQSDMPRGQRKKKRGLMGKLRSLTKGKGAESEGSMQGSDSDVSIASDYRSSKGNLKGRLSDMFKRSSSSTRESNDRIASEASLKPVSVTTLNVSNGRTEQTPPPTTPRVRRAGSRPPTPTGSGTTPSFPRKTIKPITK